MQKNNETNTTIGLDLYTKSVIIDEKCIGFQFWDTAGQERYKSIINAFYSGTNGAFILYDITNKQSFLDIYFLINDLIQ